MSLRDLAVQASEAAKVEEAAKEQQREIESVIRALNYVTAWLNDHLGLRPEKLIPYRRSAGAVLGAWAILEEDLTLFVTPKPSYWKSHLKDEDGAAWLVTPRDCYWVAPGAAHHGIHPDGLTETSYRPSDIYRVVDLPSLGEAIQRKERADAKRQA